MANEVMAKEDVGREDSSLIQVLKTSLYVGAKDESVQMVLSYCRAAGLDVMQKPVHIVPMNTKDPVSGRYEWRDVVMPGIGLYRIQADRSGTMAGISAPEFGPDITQDFTTKDDVVVSVKFPEWCQITARKVVGDHVVEFVAKEYWIENYATDSGKSSAPNAMWRKRPRGQLAKCAEAQALRKGWPEIGSAPTAEEMEGKIIDMGTAERVDEKPAPKVFPEYPQESFDSNLSVWQKRIDEGKSKPDDIITMVESRFKMTEEQKRIVRGESEQ